MSAAPRDTASQYSKGLAALRGAFSRVASGIAARPDLVRWGLAAVGFVGAILLILSEFSTVTHVKVITVVLPKSERNGFDQNSGAMLILGLVALPMLVGAAWGSARPAMIAVGGIGVIALLIALVGDLPDVTKVGTIFRERYEDARAEAQIGFTFEWLGAVLLILSAGLMLLTEMGGKALTVLDDAVNRAKGPKGPQEPTPEPPTPEP
jgi:hypothetical protein